MRCLYRNRQAFKYAPYLSSDELMNEGDEYTGEREPKYREAVTLYGNISPANGRADVQAFGVELNYDKVIVMERIPDDLTETAGLWVDDLDAEAPDYAVRRISRSLNSVEIAIARVYVE